MAHWRDRGIPATRFKLSSPQIFAEHNSTFAISAVNENLQDKPPFFWASVLATYATRPLPCLSKRVDFLERALFGDVPASSVVAVHARVDRAKAKEARTHATRGYVSRAIAVINAYGYTVYSSVGTERTRPQKSSRTSSAGGRPQGGSGLHAAWPLSARRLWYLFEVARARRRGRDFVDGAVRPFCG